MNRARDNLFFIFGCLILLFLRAPDRLTNPQFVVEDGPIFFLRSYVFGWKSLLLQFQAGYEVLALKLVALLCRPLPPSVIPAAYAGFSVFFLVLVMSYLLSHRIAMRNKHLAALALVFNPVDPDLYFCLTFSIWISAVLLLLVLLSEPPVTLAGKLLDALVILIFGLTGPFVLFWLPFFVMKSLRLRTSWNFTILVLAILCALIQGALLIEGYQDRSGGAFSADGAAWQAVVLSIFGRLFWTPRLGVEEPLPLLGLLLSSIVLYAALSYTLLRQSEWRWLMLISAALMVGFLAMFSYRANPKFLTINSGRYGFLPLIAVSWGLLQVHWCGKSRLIAVVLGCFYLNGALMNFRATPLTDYQWKEASRCFVDKTPCHIALNFDKNSIHFESHPASMK